VVYDSLKSNFNLLRNHRACPIIVLLWIGISATSGQADHYWSQNFNTESSLVAGAVVGGEAGPAALYYNPSLIARDEAHEFALSASLISFQFIKAVNIAGTGTESIRFTAIVRPKYISYSKTSKKNERLNYSLGILTKYSSNHNFNYFYQNKMNLIERLDGDESHIARISYKRAFDDLYIGGGISYVLIDNLTIGASSFISVKIMDYRTILDIQAMHDTTVIYSNGIQEPYYFASTGYSEFLKYWHASLILKLGLHYRTPNKRFSIGGNITLPNLPIHGESEVAKDYYRSNVFDNSVNAFTTDLSATGYQDRVRTSITDPFSIAFGLQYVTPDKKNAFMFTSEYFFPISSYEIMNDQFSPILGNISFKDESAAMNYKTKSQAVFNVALGFIQNFSEKLTVSGGFKTDFNNLSDLDQPVWEDQWTEPINKKVYFNKYHLIAGPVLRLENFGIILGIQYTWGRKRDLYNITNLTNAIEYNPETELALQGERQPNMSFTYNEISVFFGITYGLGRN
jgi:hypothetical protein